MTEENSAKVFRAVGDAAPTPNHALLAVLVMARGPAKVDVALVDVDVM